MDVDVKCVFLQLIENYPVLYDPRHPEFKNTRGPEKSMSHGEILQHLIAMFPERIIDLTIDQLRDEWEKTRRGYRTQFQNGTNRRNHYDRYLRWYQPFINTMIIHPLNAQQVIEDLVAENYYLMGQNNILRDQNINQQVTIGQLQQDNVALNNIVTKSMQQIRLNQLQKQQTASNIIQELFR